jgi:hypothetical protein
VGTSNLVIAPLLDASLQGGPEQRAELDLAIANRMRDGHLREIMVWDANGNVIYADDAAEIGLQEEPPPEVTEAIKRGTISSAFEDQPETTTLSEEEIAQGFV